MQINRRTFLHSLTVAVAVAAAGGAGVTLAQKTGRRALHSLPPDAYSNPVFSMSAKQFEPFIGQQVIATSSDGTAFRLGLSEVNNLDNQANAIGGAYGECFSLIFEGSDRLRLDQGVYEFTFNGLEPFSALLVPTGRRRRQFELIINHVTF
jgi:hypothetical protein